LKLPFPAMTTSPTEVSPALSLCVGNCTEREKSPTAPEKSAGFPSSGKGSTLILVETVSRVLLRVV